MVARVMEDGEQLGSWTILEAYPKGAKKGYARVRCSCGLECLRFRAAIRAGKSTRCLKCGVAQAVRRFAKPAKMENEIWRIVELTRPMRVYECKTCEFRVRATNWPVRCVQCHPHPTSRAHKLVTGISHEGIRQRILHGWSVADATTRKRGDIPDYILEARK